MSCQHGFSLCVKRAIVFSYTPARTYSSNVPLQEKQFVAPVPNQSVRKKKERKDTSLSLWQASWQSTHSSLESTGRHRPQGEMQATHINKVRLEPLSQVLQECIFTLVIFQQHKVLHTSVVASVQGAFNAFSKGLPGRHCHSVCLVVEKSMMQRYYYFQGGRAQYKLTVGKDR